LGDADMCARITGHVTDAQAWYAAAPACQEIIQREFTMVTTVCHTVVYVYLVIVVSQLVKAWVLARIHQKPEQTFPNRSPMNPN
jgi:hypothetical protein